MVNLTQSKILRQTFYYNIHYLGLMKYQNYSENRPSRNCCVALNPAARLVAYKTLLFDQCLTCIFLCRTFLLPPPSSKQFPEDCTPAQHNRTKPLQTDHLCYHNKSNSESTWVPPPKSPNPRDKATYLLNAHSKLDGIIQGFAENKCDPRDSSTLSRRKQALEDSSPYIYGALRSENTFTSIFFFKREGESEQAHVHTSEGAKGQGKGDRETFF